MVSPIDYRLNVQSPFEAAVQGFQFGRGIQQAQRQDADYARQQFDLLDAEKKQSALSFGWQTLGALESENISLAKQMLTERAVAMRNAGDELQAKAYEDAAAAAEMNPKWAKTTVDYMMRSLDPEYDARIARLRGGAPEARFGTSRDVAVNPDTGKPEYFVTNEAGEKRWLGVGPVDTPQRPRAARMVTAADGQVYWLQEGEQLPEGVRLPAKPDQGPQTTEGERNAAGFFYRAVDAGKEINKLEDMGGALPTEATSIAAMFGDYPERLSMTPKQQVYRTQAMGWIRAKLRKESGATIQADEAEAEYRTYFPVPGDTPERIAAKRRLREIAEQELKLSAGRSIKPEAGAASPADAPVPATTPASPSSRESLRGKYGLSP